MAVETMGHLSLILVFCTDSEGQPGQGFSHLPSEATILGHCLEEGA